MKGLHEYRFKTNPLEERFAEKWAEQNELGNTLEYILSSTVNEREPVAEREKVVVATMMQWLGSPVGQAFLEDALGFDVRKHIPKELTDLT